MTPTAYSIAVISDVHLPVGPRPPLSALVCKRGLSWLSWTRKRSKLHRPEVLAALMQDVKAAQPDHLLVCGDLTNLGLAQEFAQARAWLQAAGAPDKVTVIPGNHDALVPGAWESGRDLWGEWMTADPGANTPREPFPFVRNRGPAAIVGVSTAVPSPIGLATGAVGAAQMERLRRTLLDLRTRDRFRILALHHPITHGAVSARKALTDQADLRAVLAETGADLVVHGHSHEASLNSIAGPDGPIPVVGVGSASQIFGAGHHEAASWRMFRVSRSGDQWRCAVDTRRLTGDGGFESLGTYVLTTSAVSPCRSDSAA